MVYYHGDDITALGWDFRLQPIRKRNKKMNPALCCSVYKKYFDEFYR